MKTGPLEPRPLKGLDRQLPVRVLPRSSWGRTRLGAGAREPWVCLAWRGWRNPWEQLQTGAAALAPPWVDSLALLMLLNDDKIFVSQLVYKPDAFTNQINCLCKKMHRPVLPSGLCTSVGEGKPTASTLEGRWPSQKGTVEECLVYLQTANNIEVHRENSLNFIHEFPPQTTN